MIHCSQGRIQAFSLEMRPGARYFSSIGAPTVKRLGGPVDSTKRGYTSFYNVNQFQDYGSQPRNSIICGEWGPFTANIHKSWVCARYKVEYQEPCCIVFFSLQKGPLKSILGAHFNVVPGATATLAPPLIQHCPQGKGSVFWLKFQSTKSPSNIGLNKECIAIIHLSL